MRREPWSTPTRNSPFWIRQMTHPAVMLPAWLIVGGVIGVDPHHVTAECAELNQPGCHSLPFAHGR
jgi:hypothetical protein